MTLPEFFGCAFLAFGPPLAMFTMTIAQDPIRIIILVAAAFLWLCSLLISSFIWFIFVPLRDVTIFGMIISILIQVNWWRRFFFGFCCNFLNLRVALMPMLLENPTIQRFLRPIFNYNPIKFVSLLQEAFRYGLYRILRETENGLQLVSDNSRIVENKHILAYVSGLGFGIMSGAFALVNILADSVSFGRSTLKMGYQQRHLRTNFQMF